MAVMETATKQPEKSPGGKAQDTFKGNMHAMLFHTSPGGRAKLTT